MKMGKLVRVKTDVEFKEIKEWLEKNKHNLFNHSVSWYNKSWGAETAYFHISKKSIHVLGWPECATEE